MIADLKSRPRVLGGGRDNFTATRPVSGAFAGDLSNAGATVDNSMTDQMAAQGQRQQADDAARQAQYQQIAQQIGGALSQKFAKKDNTAPAVTNGDAHGDGSPARAPMVADQPATPLDNQPNRRAVLTQAQPGEQPSDTAIRMGQENDARLAAMSPAERKYETDIKPLLTRDYSKGGKDNDKHHNWLDVLKSVGLGALQATANADPRMGIGGMIGSAIGGAGAGAVATAVDRNADNKMLDQLKLRQQLPQYEAMAKVESQQNDEKRKDASFKSIIDNRNTDNARQQADLERKAAKDTAQMKYWERKADQGDLKLAGDDELRTLRDKWMESKDKNDTRRLDLVEQEMKNRMTRAANSQAGMDRRKTFDEEVRRAGAALADANKNKRQADAIAARERLVQLKKEADMNRWGAMMGDNGAVKQQ